MAVPDSTEPGIYAFYRGPEYQPPIIYRRWDGHSWSDSKRALHVAVTARINFSQDYYRVRVEEAISVTRAADINGESIPKIVPGFVQLDLFQ